jgi:hypothetical protein
VRRELWHENTVIDIVKFDVEGDEFSVLENMLDDPDALYNVKYLMFEACLRHALFVFSCIANHFVGEGA